MSLDKIINPGYANPIKEISESEIRFSRVVFADFPTENNLIKIAEVEYLPVNIDYSVGPEHHKEILTIYTKFILKSLKTKQKREVISSTKSFNVKKNTDVHKDEIAIAIKYCLNEINKDIKSEKNVSPYISRDMVITLPSDFGTTVSDICFELNQKSLIYY